MIREVPKPSAGAAGASAPRQDPRLQQLEAAAHSFEALFFQLLMNTMRSTVHKSDFMDGGRGEAVFTELFDREVADRAGGRPDGIGIAKMILKQYSKHVTANAAPTFDRKG